MYIGTKRKSSRRLNYQTATILEMSFVITKCGSSVFGEMGMFISVSGVLWGYIVDVRSV